MLLDDIISLATDDKTSISVLLRKCVVLAHQLKNDRLKSWANHELNGYENASEVPPYRKIAANSKGNFSGPYGSSWTGMPIPSLALDEEHRQFAEEAILSQAIAAYEEQRRLPSGGSLSILWPNNLALYYSQRIPNNKGMVLISAWQEFAESSIVELLDSVRNRVLNLALEIQEEVGPNDADLKSLSPQAVERVERTVIQQIYGGTFYVASGQANIQVQHSTLVAGNWAQLEDVLQQAGLSTSDVKELSTAVSEDGSKLGTKVLEWIKKNAPKAVSGGIKVGTSVGQSLLTEYLKQHFGMC